jgi:outer membrane lipoprotein-sorting protein
MKNILYIIFILFTVSSCSTAAMIKDLNSEVTESQSIVIEKNTKNKDTETRFKSYLNEIKNMKGKFIQTSSNGEVKKGVFYISKPGRMRIEYDNGMLLLADGENFIYYDAENDQISMLDLASSPVYILLSKNGLDGINAKIDKIEAKTTYKLIFTSIKPSALNVSIAFKAEDNPFKLLGWIVKDMNGIITNFAITDMIETTENFPKKTFILDRQKTYGSDGIKSKNDYY